MLIGKALMEIPPKFAGLPPLDPRSQAEIKRGGYWNGKGTQGLAETCAITADGCATRPKSVSVYCEERAAALHCVAHAPPKPPTHWHAARNVMQMADCKHKRSKE